MKRSEALDIIDGILIDHELPVLQGISKEILGALEKAGMLPPRANVLKRSYMTDDYGDVIFDEMIKTVAYEWEPE